MNIDSPSCLRYSTSLRTRSLDATLVVAQALGRALGVTRVTDITRLDCIGIPVFASIRPSALAGSLCVNAGKGFTAQEARVGAWMEAIEYALAEPGAAPVPIVVATAREVLDGNRRAEAILDLCPLQNHRIHLDEPMQCVWAEEVLGGEAALLPAERVFVPAQPALHGPSHFGSSTCGLASGNTLIEATVHALTEAIEHDIGSFQLLNDTACEVQQDELHQDELPPTAAAVVEAIRRAGLDITMLYGPNVFGIPYFQALIRDPGADTWKYRNGGYGCHPHRDIALTRALCEAVQSRLSFIHGGRDDLTDWEQYHNSKITPPPKPGTNLRRERIRYSDIADYAVQTPNLEACFIFLVGCLQRMGLSRLYRVAFTAPGDPIQVVKVIVPGLEEFDYFLPRIGPRLAAYAESL